MMKLYVCSRLRASQSKTLEEHQDLAKRYARFILEKGYGAPFVPHLMYPTFLDDSDAFERKAGIESGLAFLAACDACFVFLDETREVSGGMLEEIRFAIRNGVLLKVFVLEDGELVPDENRIHKWVQNDLLVQDFV